MSGKERSTVSINRYDQEEMYGQVLGIGIDQIECDRVLRSCEKKNFLEHCYTTKELEMISRHKRSSATNFCGKEAVVKAFGTGFRKITPNEIEILRNESGAPYVLLYGRAKDKADQIGVKKILISLADTKTQAIAFVVLLG